MKIKVVPTIQTKYEVISMYANSKDEKINKLIDIFLQLSEEEKDAMLEKAAAMCQENEKTQRNHDITE